MTLGLSLFLFALGAILRFAVTADVAGIELKTVGLILMIIGVVGFLVTLALLISRRDRLDAQRRY